MRSLYDWAGLTSGTVALMASDVMQHAGLPWLAPWLNYGGLGILAGVLLYLLRQAHKDNHDQAAAFATERVDAARRLDELTGQLLRLHRHSTGGDPCERN